MTGKAVPMALSLTLLSTSPESCTNSYANGDPECLTCK